MAKKSKNLLRQLINAIRKGKGSEVKKTLNEILLTKIVSKVNAKRKQISKLLIGKK